MFGLQSNTDEEYHGGDASDHEAKQVAAQRRAHIERCDRWLSVMIPEASDD